MISSSTSYQRNNYLPNQKSAYRISRSKIELFVQCQRCFWLDCRLHITRPSSPPFNINKAIDELFKKEFDSYRVKSKPHPIMVESGIDALPMQHDSLEDWRQNFVGVGALHQPTNLLVFGAIDDLWVDSAGQAIVVDYKATAKDREVNINSDWQLSYKRQLEVYQWLLRQNGLIVNDVGYFVYANAVVKGIKGFNNQLEFTTKLIPYTGNDSWIEPTLLKIKQCLDSELMPPVGVAAMGGACEYCSYAKSRTELTLAAIDSKLNRRQDSKHK